MEGEARIVLCKPGGRRAPVEVAVQDISSLGIGIVRSEPMKAGDRFILLLTGSTAHGSQAILCQVARWQPLHDGTYSVGAAFVRELEMPGPRQMPAGVTDSLSAEEQAEVRKYEERLAACTQ